MSDRREIVFKEMHEIMLKQKLKGLYKYIQDKITSGEISKKDDEMVYIDMYGMLANALCIEKNKYNEVLSFVKSLNKDKSEQAYIFAWMGEGLRNDEYDIKSKLLKEAVSIQERRNIKDESMLLAAKELGDLYDEKEPKESIKYIEKAINIIKTNPKTTKRLKLGTDLGDLYKKMAVCYARVREYKLAVLNLEMALPYFARDYKKASEEYVEYLLELAEICFSGGDFKKVIKYGKLGLKYNAKDDVDWGYGEAKILSILAHSYDALGQVTSAIKQFELLWNKFSQDPEYDDIINDVRPMLLNLYLEKKMYDKISKLKGEL